MNKKASDNEEILDAITDLSGMVDERLQRVEMTLSDTNQRLLSVESAQRETNERLGKLENRFYAYESDIKELYSMVFELRGDVDTGKLYGIELDKRLTNVEAFAILISKKTGIKFK